MMMSFIVKGSVFLYLLTVLMVQGHSLSIEQVMLVLLIVIFTLLIERFKYKVVSTIGILLLTIWLVQHDSRFIVLFALSMYDFTLQRKYSGSVITLAIVIAYLWGQYMGNDLVYVLVLLMSAGLGYVVDRREHEKIQLETAVDHERRLRYELERARLQLLQSSMDIAAITEVKERERIAREIHDHVGHQLSATLIQLQAAAKLHQRDAERAMVMVDKSIINLMGSVDLLRDTVHNLKPNVMMGENYLRSLVEEFTYCPVELQIRGNWEQVPSLHLELIIVNMKEALTNCARHSGATKLHIILDANTHYTRSYIKDNGRGCGAIREGMGISGMKERVRMAGGSLSITSEEGFLIVCVIPREYKGGLA